MLLLHAFFRLPASTLPCVLGVVRYTFVKTTDHLFYIHTETVRLSMADGGLANMRRVRRYRCNWRRVRTMINNLFFQLRYAISAIAVYGRAVGWCRVAKRKGLLMSFFSFQSFCRLDLLEEVWRKDEVVEILVIGIDNLIFRTLPFFSSFVYK